MSGLPPSRMAAAQAQPKAAPQPAPPAARPADVVVMQNASETRERLREVLQEFPPALGQVLRLDSSLVANADYLAPYPVLAAFLAQHPEVARNPSYYFGGDPRYYPETSARRDAINALEEIAAGTAFFIFFLSALAAVTHISRSVLEHRRWLQATKVQTEAHTKLVDRLASNEDLMTYIQSPAGQRFLSASALQIEPGNRGAIVAAPVARILGSVQIGVVAACGGLGLWIAKNQVINEVAQPLSVISILGFSLGVGFVLSAVVAYAMSRQLGLIGTSSSHA